MAAESATAGPTKMAPSLSIGRTSQSRLLFPVMLAMIVCSSMTVNAAAIEAFK